MYSSAHLDELLEASKAAAMQQQAIDMQALTEVLRTLSQLLQQLQEFSSATEDQRHMVLRCLRVLRNACAAGAAVAPALQELALMPLLATLLDLVGGPTLSLDWQVPQACAQLLANSTQASAACAAAAWQYLFPRQLTMLAHIHSGSTQAATALTLLACCRRCMDACSALASPQGEPILTALLCGHHRQLQGPQGQGNDSLGLLATHLCLARGLLPRVWQSLGSAEGQQAAVQDTAAVAPTLAHVALLQELCSEAELEAPGELPGGGADGPDAGQPSCSPAPSMSFLVHLVGSLAAQGKSSPLSPGQQQVLQDGLRLVRDIAGRDDDGASLGSGVPLVPHLQAAGCVPLLLAMLSALQPIQQTPREVVQVDVGAGPAPPTDLGAGSSTGGGGAQVQELAPEVAGRAEALPWSPPYPGYRSDILAALANLAHRRPSVQRQVSELQGVVLVLAQCQLDRESPLAREWGLWAVRNLCEGNEAAQAAIAELKACAALDSEELRRMGVRLELDEASGKPRVVKSEGPPLS